MPPLHVGLNCIFLVPGETGGTETYARELARELVELGLRVTAFVNRELATEHPDALPDAVGRVVVGVKARSRVQWVRGEQQYLPSVAARAGVSLLHSLASTGPAYGRTPRVVTVHDLLHRVVPEAHFRAYRFGMRVLVPLAARGSACVITPSAATARDVERLLHVDRTRIEVVPEGVRPVGTVWRSADVARARAVLGVESGRPVLLCLSARRPHKNLAGLLSALARMDPAERPVALLPGYPTPYERDLREIARQLGVSDDIVWKGWLSTDELELAWSLADAFVLPSLYEGFGLPLLEALARGVPTAASNRASLPEVAADAALFFDPDDPAQIATSIRRLLTDASLRARLRSGGPARAAWFTWRRCAEGTVAAYERALRSTP